MAHNIKLKRSAVAAKVPLTTDLALGELAINTTDGKMYFKKDVSGTASIIQLANDNEVVKLAGGPQVINSGPYIIGTGRSGTTRFDNTLEVGEGESQVLLQGNNTNGGLVFASSRMQTRTLDLNNLISGSAFGRLNFFSGLTATNGGRLVFGASFGEVGAPVNGEPTPGIYGSIENLKVPTTDYEAANKKYVDDQVATKANDSDVAKLASPNTFTSTQTFSSLLIPQIGIQLLPATLNTSIPGNDIIFYSGSNATNGGRIRFGVSWSEPILQTTPKGSIENLKVPTTDYEAANKKYVDDQVATKANSSHTHGNITNAGSIGSTSGLPIITGTSGVLQAGAFGTGAGQFAEGNHNHTLASLSGVSISSPTTGQVLKYNGTNWINDTDATGSGTLSDGDKGDITVSNSGATWVVDNAAITYAKIQNVSTTSRLLGRASAGAGAIEEITIGTGLSLNGTTLESSGGSVPDFILMSMGVV